MGGPLMTDETTPETQTPAEPVAAAEVKPATVGGRVATFFMWVKVVAIVVLVVLVVIVVLQNLNDERAKADVRFILDRWSPSDVPVAIIVAVSFVMGVIITLLLMFLRRSSRKRA